MRAANPQAKQVDLEAKAVTRVFVQQLAVEHFFKAPADIAAVVRAQVLFHIGDAGALPAALHIGNRDESTFALNAELRMLLGLALLQAGRVDEAIPELEGARAMVVDPDEGPGSATRTALALALAAAGDSVRARELADEGEGKGTYLDQQGCRLAGAFARLQSGDDDAVSAFDEALTRVDETEARLDQTIVRLARARAWTALGHPDREAVDAEARSAIGILGYDLGGWDRVFRSAAGAAAGATSR